MARWDESMAAMGMKDMEMEGARHATQARFMTPKTKKERHQHRAAAETIEAVRQPEARGAEESRPPQPHEERERRAAFLETGGFERG